MSEKNEKDIGKQSLTIESKHKSLKLNAFVNTIKTLASLLFPLITFPYASRVLGVRQVGKYNFANSIISYFLLLAALGISSYAIREGSQYRYDKKKISEFASEIFSINIISSIVSYILLFVCLILVRRLDSCRTEIVIFSFEIVITTFGIEWLYNIYEDFVYIAIRSFIFQCLSLILLFLLVKGPRDLDNYVLVTVISMTGNNFFNWFHAKRYCKIRFTCHINWKRHLKPIFIIFSTTVAVAIYVSSDTTMLGFLVSDNNYTVGIYSVATKIYNIFKNIIVSFLVVLIPRFSSIIHEDGGRVKASNLFNKLSTVLITVATPMIFGLIMLAQDVIIIVSGIEYLHSVSSLRILMLACFFSFFAYLFSQCILIPNRREKVFLIATAISAVTNIGLNFVLIPIMHEVGTAVTTLLAEMITFILVYHSSKPYIDFNIHKKDIFSVIIGTIAIICICLLCNKFVNSIVLRVSGAIFISVLAYWLILKGLNNSVTCEIEKMLSNKFHKK